MKEWLVIDLLVSVGIYTSFWEGGTFGPMALIFAGPSWRHIMGPLTERTQHSNAVINRIWVNPRLGFFDRCISVKEKEVSHRLSLSDRIGRTKGLCARRPGAR